MGKITSKVRQARLNYQQGIGRDVSIQEVAQAIGITRAALSKIERGQVEGVDTRTHRTIEEQHALGDSFEIGWFRVSHALPLCVLRPKRSVMLNRSEAPPLQDARDPSLWLRPPLRMTIPGEVIYV